MEPRECPTAHLWPTRKVKAVKGKTFVPEDRLHEVLADTKVRDMASIEEAGVEFLRKDLIAAEAPRRDVLRHDGMYEQQVQRREEHLLSDGALEKHEKALLLRKQAFGKDSAEVAETLNSMAIVCKSQGQHQEALEHYEECLRIRTEHFGEMHPDVAVTLHNKGLLLYELRSWSEAASSFARAKKLRARLFGDADPLTKKSQKCEQEALQRNQGWAPPSKGKHTAVPLRTPRAGPATARLPHVSPRDRESTSRSGALSRPTARRGSDAAAEGGAAARVGAGGRRLSLPSVPTPR